MASVIIPHRDINKAGATEHVDAILKSLRERNVEGIVVADPVNNYEKTAGGKLVPCDLKKQIEHLASDCPKANFIALSGDYGADPTPEAPSVAALFKAILGENQTKVVVSSYTAESRPLLGALERGEIDHFAIPESAIAPETISGTAAEPIIRANREALIPLTSVPHILTRDTLKSKYAEWAQAAAEGKVKALPSHDLAQPLNAVVIPGDVEDATGSPKYFTTQDAENLADAIVEAGGKTAIYMISNGPRTYKYNKAACDAALQQAPASFNPNNAVYQNPDRMNGLSFNPVAKAFANRLIEQGIPPENIIDGCIAKGLVPPQGFLAFYEALNLNKGESKLFVDGVSVTMMAQAANVTTPSVRLIATDTPAKNKTHEVALKFFVEKANIDQLRLTTNSRYIYIENPLTRETAKTFDDASKVADKIVELATTKAFFRPKTARKQTTIFKPDI